MRLNNEIVTERTLVDMFRRKTAADIEGEICPYCEYVNTAGSTTCVQCYYELNKAPRDQGEELSQELSNSIFDELMSDDDDSWQEGEARDVVLTLDSDPLEVGQYEATNFEEEEPEMGYLNSSCTDSGTRLGRKVLASKRHHSVVLLTISSPVLWFLISTARMDKGPLLASMWVVTSTVSPSTADFR